MTVPSNAPEVAGLAPELAGAKKGQGQSPLASASERFTSYDVEAFEVPGGREENWRFTPLRRLRGLHDGSGTVADNLEIVLADASRLTLVVTEEWADDAVHLGAHHASVGRDARLHSTAVAFGGDLVRVTETVTYRGPGGEAELYGLGYADAGQHLEQRLFVDHAVPHCRSNVLYKNALQGDGAHTVWIGDVLIRAAAEGTETFEFNRNLVLTERARADSVPNLEIETGEITGAGHASATGRFDDEQLFYLQSRGIPEDVARRLVVRGFFGEILSKITMPELRERLEAAVEAELALTGA